MPDAPERLYFAYGSNVNLAQMACRCPHATPLGPVTLNGYRLLFRGDTPNYGVATIAPHLTGQVKGLLWRITPACEASLDLYEGFPHLYGKEAVQVMDRAGNTYSVMAYVMTPARSQEAAYPSISYYTSIAQGYEQNGIPMKTLQEALQHCRMEVQTQEGADRYKDWGAQYKPHSRDER